MSLASGGHLQETTLREGRKYEGCLDPNLLELCNGSLTWRGLAESYNSFVNDESSDSACSSADRVVDHPVVLFRRQDAYNPFHAHEGFLALWSTYLARGLDPCNTEVMLSDERAYGPYLEMLRRVFAPVRGISRVSDARPRPLCLRRLILAAAPPVHFEIPYNAHDRFKGFVCGRSPWLVGFARYVRAAFGLSFADGHHSATGRLPHVTLLDRQPHRLTPGGKPTKTSTYRSMANREKLIKSLAELCSERTATAAEGLGARRSAQVLGSGTSQCTHTVADLTRLPIAAQLRLITSTDVLTGTHAAGFTFLIYLPPHARVVEFASHTDFHYDNLASYVGISKVRLPSMAHHQPSYTLDIPQAIKAIRDAVGQVHDDFRSGTVVGEPRHPPTEPRVIDWPEPTMLPSMKQSNAPRDLRRQAQRAQQVKRALPGRPAGWLRLKGFHRSERRR